MAAMLAAMLAAVVAAKLLHCKTYNLKRCTRPSSPRPIDTPSTVKFQPDILPGTNVITRHAAGQLWVGAIGFSTGLLVPWVGMVQPWSNGLPQALAAADFEAVLALQPELVIFGSGSRLRFVAPAVLRGLIERRSGVETMDTPAACRTFNVLVSEGRRAVAALLPTSAAP